MEHTKYFGFAGKVLRVDLSSGTIETSELDKELARKFIGGAGLATKIIWDETKADTTPFSAQNPLIFATGPITATKVPTSGRYVVASLSPLTNIYGQSHAGGVWGHALKLAGWDVVIVKGVSPKPVYLWIDGDRVDLRDAGHLWGKDNWETDEGIRAELGKGVSVASIGRAGERLVRMACICNDGKIGRFAARCGLGAVMGSKKLKALAVRGNRRPKVHDDGNLKRSIAANFIRTPLDPEAERERRAQTRGKGRVVAGVKNYQTADLQDFFGGFQSKFKEHSLSGDRLYCAGCGIGCFESERKGDRRAMTGENAQCLGARCLVDDFDVLEEASDLCNRYGMDAMSVGGVVAFAMELYDSGIINQSDTGGIDLIWGRGEALLAMVRQIGEREGLGKVLGEGVKRAAEHFGGLAIEFAMHVKGHEFPLMDVRAWNAGALEFATSSTGAHHFEGATISSAIHFPLAEELREVYENRFAIQGTGKVVAAAQDYGNVIDCLVACKMLLGGWTHTFQPVKPEYFLEWLNCVTGWQMTTAELTKAGERIFNLKRMINVRRGISRKDDTLPPRLLSSKRGFGVGGTADNLPPLGIMLNEYYASRGWSEEGIPIRAKLSELDLQETLEFGR